MEAVVIFVGLVVGLGSFAWSVGQRRKQEECWRAIGQELGLATEGLEMVGSLEPDLSLKVEGVKVRSGKTTHMTTVLTVEGTAMSSPVSIGMEGFFSRTFGSDVQVGHGAFDDSFRVEGTQLDAFALLGADVRRLLLDLGSSHSVSFADSTLTVTAQNVVVGHDLRVLIAVASELAQACCDQRSVAERLALNASSDSVGSVRHRNLKLLLSSFHRDPVAIDAAKRALDSSDPDLELEAAMFLMDIDKIAQHAIAGLSETRARAVDALAAVPVETAGVAGALQQIQPTGEGKLDAALAEALAAHPIPERQPRLLSILASSEEPAQLAAARALATVGDLDAVESLLVHVNKTFGGELKAVSRQAIAEIQARAKGTRGGLTVAEDAPAAGALSPVVESP